MHFFYQYVHFHFNRYDSDIETLLCFNIVMGLYRSVGLVKSIEVKV